MKRNESMAHTLQAKLKEPEADENKRGPRPQDLIRLYDIILQVNVLLSSLVSKLCWKSKGLRCTAWCLCYHSYMMCILWFFSPPPPPPTIQSLAELSTLQGLEDDHTFQKEVSLKTLVYKAYRSVFLCLVFNMFCIKQCSWNSNSATRVVFTIANTPASWCEKYI